MCKYGKQLGTNFIQYVKICNLGKVVKMHLIFSI